MAITSTVSTQELQRVAAAAYEGKTLNVMLCSVGVSGFTAESTIADWQTVEASGSGYARFSKVIAVGAYNTASGKYELPVVDAPFTATGTFTYDTVVLYVDGATHPHSVITETPNIVLSAGQVQTYRLNLSTDD